MEVWVRVFVPVFGRVFLEVSLVWIEGSDVPRRSGFLHHWFLVAVLDVATEGLSKPKK